MQAPKLGSSKKRVYMFGTFFFTRTFGAGYDYDRVRRWPKKVMVDKAALELLLIPVNLSNEHWVLVAADLKAREFVYYDSLRGGGWRLQGRVEQCPNVAHGRG